MTTYMPQRDTSVIVNEVSKPSTMRFIVSLRPRFPFKPQVAKIFADSALSHLRECDYSDFLSARAIVFSDHCAQWFSKWQSALTTQFNELR